MKTKLIQVLSLLVLLSACAVSSRINTPSGKPEITVPAPKKQTMDAIVQAVVGDGFQLRRLDEYTAVLGKPSESFVTNLLSGSRYDPTAEERVIFNFFEVPSGTRVIITMQIVTNPGSAFERVRDISHGRGAQELQAGLDNLVKGPTSPYGTSTSTTPNCFDPKVRVEFQVLCSQPAR